jgi:hypothetical protein
MRRALLLSALLLATALPPAIAQAALPEAVKAAAGDWRSLGRGELRWLGIRVYEASLWVSGVRLDFERPFALALRYARDIPGEKLVGTSIDELRRLGFGSRAQLDDWESRVADIFPDVRAGDTIVGLYLPGRGARFFHRGSSVGEIADIEFARGFFAIWLDPRTREPALRQQLLALPAP